MNINVSLLVKSFNDEIETYWIVPILIDCCVSNGTRCSLQIPLKVNYTILILKLVAIVYKLTEFKILNVNNMEKYARILTVSMHADNELNVISHRKRKYMQAIIMNSVLWNVVTYWSKYTKSIIKFE